MLTRVRGGIPRVRHEEVVEKFVDYHFGRLSPQMNLAIERHVRSCARCKREGLRNAASERKGSLRQLRSVRGGKPLLGRRGRNWIMVLMIVLVMQVVIYEIANGHSRAFLSVLSHSGPSVQTSGDTNPPINLTSVNALPLVTSGASAIALSPDDKRLAVAGGDSQHNVTIWDVGSDKPLTTLQWPDPTTPGALAWSVDGARLAATDGTQATVWQTSNGAVVWQFGIPAAPAMRVYDVDQQVVVGRPDPATALNGAGLVWGADGALNPAPSGALGPAGVSTPLSPVVGIWTSAGAHIFADNGAAKVGASASDAQSGQTLLAWAPDARYLLWGAFAQTVAQPAAKGGAGQGSAPDAIVGTLAAHIAQVGASADALVWLAPKGKLVAVCDKSTADAHLQIVEIATAHVKYQLPETCASLTTHSALWSSAGKTFYVIPAKGPIAIYNIGG